LVVCDTFKSSDTVSKALIASSMHLLTLFRRVGFRDASFSEAPRLHSLLAATIARLRLDRCRL
jgi:hypothetical protein